MAEHWTAAYLEERCAFYRDVFLGDGTATAPELDAYWPGGEENPETGHDGWIVAYGRCLWLLGRRIGREQASRPESDTVDAALMAAQRGEPETVELVERSPDGEPQYRQVYPKSEHALAQCADRDFKLRQLSEAFDLLKGMPPADASDLNARLLAEISYQHHVLIWIVCSEGPQSPITDDAIRPEPPAWTLRLDPLDVFRLCAAHHRVNGRRLGLLAHLVGSHPHRDHRPSWATLAAQAASELHTSSRHLLRDWSLEGWLAQLHLTAQAKADAIDAAKRQRAG